MAKQKEDKKVVFRRIGGRIIPIAVGGSFIAGSRNLNKIHEKAKNQARNRTGKIPNKHYNYDTAFGAEGKMLTRKGKLESIKRIYKKDAGMKILRNTKVNSNLGAFYGTSAKDYYVSGRDKAIVLSNVDQPTFLHELSHYKQDIKKTKINEMVRKMNDRKSFQYDVVSKASSIYAKFEPTELFKDVSTRSRIRNKFWDTFDNKINPIVKSGASKYYSTVKFAHEAEAWKMAYGMGKSKKVKKRIASQGLKALSTYVSSGVVRGAKYGIMATGASLIGYGIFKEK